MSLLSIVIFFSSLSFFVTEEVLAAKVSKCEHFWRNLEGEYEISGKVVGENVGISPFLTVEQKMSRSGGLGKYTCILEINRDDVLNGLYFYIGEVGDASTLKVVSTPLGLSQKLPISHGLYEDTGKKAEYYRVVPFWVNLRDIYEGDGEHRVDIIYSDIVFPQSGMRSGLPTVEDFQGVVKRFISDSPRITVFLGFCLVYLFCLFIGVFWKGVPLKNRWGIVSASMASFCVIFSITTIPRMLIDPFLAIKMNRVITVVAPLLLFWPFFNYLKFNSKSHVYLSIYSQLVMAVIGVLVLWNLPPESFLFGTLYWGFIVIQLGLYPIVLSILSWKGQLQGAFSSSHSKIPQYLFFLLGSVVIRDVLAQTVFSDFNSVFYSHFVFFNLLLATLIYLQLAHQKNILDFQNEIQMIKNRAIAMIIKPATHNLVFNNLAKDLGVLSKAGRVSISELVDSNSHRFVGYSGNFKNILGIQKIENNSRIHTIVEQNKTQFWLQVPKFGFDSSTGSDEKTDVAIIPFHFKDRVIGFACFTNFQGGSIPRFVRDRLELIREECGILLSVFLQESIAEKQSKLLEINRLRVYPLRQESELYFFNHFGVNDQIGSPTFLLGDMVNSTVLRKEYGNRLARTVNLQLKQLFEEFKQDGIVIDLLKGDEVQIVIPNQDVDSSTAVSANKALKLVKYISDSQSAFNQIPQIELGVHINYRFVVSQCTVDEREEGKGQAFRLFKYMSHSEIDHVARVLNNVASAGECIVLDSVFNQLSDTSDFFALKPFRLKGVPNSLNLYVYKIRNVS